jgi:hypothetical protein
VYLKSAPGFSASADTDRRDALAKWSPLEAALRRSADLNKAAAAVWLTLMWSAVLVVDDATGPHLSLNAVYLAPLCFTVWCLGRIAGLVSGLIVVGITLGRPAL